MHLTMKLVKPLFSYFLLENIIKLQGFGMKHVLYEIFWIFMKCDVFFWLVGIFWLTVFFYKKNVTIVPISIMLSIWKWSVVGLSCIMLLKTWLQMSNHMAHGWHGPSYLGTAQHVNNWRTWFLSWTCVVVLTYVENCFLNLQGLFWLWLISLLLRCSQKKKINQLRTQKSLIIP